MKTLILLLIIVLASCSSDPNVKHVFTNEEVNMHIQRSMEYAYFEGQRDALEGDIRIDSIEDHSGTYHYIWLKSPWDFDKKPIYVPGESLNK